MTDDESIEVTLGPSEAFDKALLVPPNGRKLGPDSGRDLPFDNIRIRVHRRPVAYNLRHLFELSDRPLPENYGVFNAYDLWLLQHSFSVVREGGYKHVQQIGIHVRLPETPRYTVLNILPKTEFVKHGSLGLGLEADVAVDGRVSIPQVSLKDGYLVKELSAGGRITLIPEASFVGRISFALISPSIQAVGVGDNESMWVFERTYGSDPLWGEQTVMQVVLAPRRRKKIAITTSIYATVSCFGVVNTRLKGENLELEAILN